MWLEYFICFKRERENRMSSQYKQSAASKKIEEIEEIVLKREVLREGVDEEALRAEIKSLETEVLMAKQAAMISELCKVQMKNDILFNL